MYLCEASFLAYDTIKLEYWTILKDTEDFLYTAALNVCQNIMIYEKKLEKYVHSTSLQIVFHL